MRFWDCSEQRIEIRIPMQGVQRVYWVADVVVVRSDGRISKSDGLVEGALVRRHQGAES